MPKRRLDNLLVEKGIIQSRERAKALILSGDVRVNGSPVNKAGTLIDEDAEIELTGKDIPFVSRGGLKLEKAIKEFNINVKNKIAIDARPSDAIAMAMRTEAPIFVSENVMLKAKLVNSEKDEDSTRFITVYPFSGQNNCVIIIDNSYIFNQPDV